MAIDIIPIGSKDGQVILAGHELGMAEWSGELKIENDRFKHFGRAKRGHFALRWSGLLTGFMEGRATVKGLFDSADGQDIALNFELVPQQIIVGWLGHDDMHGWNIECEVVNCKKASNTDSPSGNKVELELEITAADWSITGPGVIETSD